MSLVPYTNNASFSLSIFHISKIFNVAIIKPSFSLNCKVEFTSIELVFIKSSVRSNVMGIGQTDPSLKVKLSNIES